jgi:hypothetical protein
VFVCFAAETFVLGWLVEIMREGKVNYVFFGDFDVLVADEFGCAVCMVVRGNWFRRLGFNVFGVLLRRFIIRFRHGCNKKQNVEKQL